MSEISVYICVCVAQAEGILRAWATPALQKDYSSDPVVTKIWNTTMMEVQYLQKLLLVECTSTSGACPEVESN